jgi:uncharacterized damage-inducible protein DinB
MNQRSVIEDLYAYNDWANHRVLQLAQDLSDAQLDAEQPMGFGTLRATLHHIVLAERLWLDRWLLKPWVPLNTDVGGATVSELGQRFREVSAERRELLDKERGDGFSRMVDYQNTAREPFRHRLSELLMHVANHGVHHRAQSLNFLRLANRRVVGGIDYLFYKLAHPTVSHARQTIDSGRQAGLEVGENISEPPHFDLEIVRRYCAYGNWAMSIVRTTIEGLSREAISQPFDMGPGNLQSIVAHIADAERWWFCYWTGREREFQPWDTTLPIEDFWKSWDIHTLERDQWLQQQTPDSLNRAVTADAEGMPLTLRVGETIVQLCGHGTHHRAQAVNLARRLGAKPQAVDYVVWIRGPGALENWK